MGRTNTCFGGHLSDCMAESIGKLSIVSCAISLRISDHLIVMRKGGYPVALNQITSNSASKTYVEDLRVPSDSQVYVYDCCLF
jgi:hypothetical protein